MKFQFAALYLLAFMSSGCSRAGSRQDELMDEIERSVVLPKGAERLAAYGRYYAFSDRQTVVASYLLPLPVPSFDEGCEEMSEDLSSRPCTKQEVATMRASSARDAAARTPPGKRRWLSSTKHLPFIADGGCMQVRIEFDPSAHRVLSVACNGRM